MIPTEYPVPLDIVAAPRTRGDDPLDTNYETGKVSCSPHARG